MPEVTWHCGQCGSAGLYRDEDRLNGMAWIACMICGNRWPGGLEPVKAAKSGKKRAITAEKEHIAMGNKRGVCSNCGRALLLVGNLCHTCYSRARGLNGESRDEALQSVRDQLAAGLKRRDQKSIPASPQEEKYPVTEERIEGQLLQTADPQTVIPVTLRLTVEIAVRVSGISA